VERIPAAEVVPYGGDPGNALRPQVGDTRSEDRVNNGRVIAGGLVSNIKARGGEVSGGGVAIKYIRGDSKEAGAGEGVG